MRLYIDIFVFINCPKSWSKWNRSKQGYNKMHQILWFPTQGRLPEHRKIFKTSKDQSMEENITLDLVNPTNQFFNLIKMASRNIQVAQVISIGWKENRFDPNGNWFWIENIRKAKKILDPFLRYPIISKKIKHDTVLHKGDFWRILSKGCSGMGILGAPEAFSGNNYSNTVSNY